MKMATRGISLRVYVGVLRLRQLKTSEHCMSFFLRVLLFMFIYLCLSPSLVSITSQSDNYVFWLSVHSQLGQTYLIRQPAQVPAGTTLTVLWILA